MASIAQTIRSRTSVRTFDGNPLTPQDRADLEGFLSHVETPFGVPVEFRMLDVAEHGLKSPVIVGAHTYVAAKAVRQEGAELSLGYAFERFCLYAAEHGMGSVMLAASLGRKAFEEAMEVGADEVMPVASPVGYPAQRRSLRGNMMRKAIRSDERLPFGKVFFADAFTTPLSPSDAGRFAEPLELLRLAPSATNKQPWRVVLSGGTVHFFEERTLKESDLGDIQKVDMGIALAHFDLARQEIGIEGSFVTRDPGIATPKGVEYITSFEATA